MRNGVIFFLLAAAFIVPLSGQNHSLEDLFPNLEEDHRAQVFSPTGLILSTNNPSGPRLIPSSDLDMDVSGSILNRNFSCLVEALLVIPYKDDPIELLKVYNALGKIRNLKGRLYHSATRDENIPLFEDATRIRSAKSSSAVSDPPDALSVPQSETIYIRVKDVNFGNSYYRADISTGRAGLRYYLSNFRSLTYLLFPVIKEDNFLTQMYFEPIAEGILVYSIAGANVSDFISSRIDASSAIRKRLEVILGWVIDGVTVF
jgi:hypothetical protein